MATITLEAFKRAAYASYLDMVAIPTVTEALADPAHPLHEGAERALARFKAERATLAGEAV